jgi:MscS family membrane protein
VINKLESAGIPVVFVTAKTIKELTYLKARIGVSRWFTIDQERIDKFADLTEDWQYIHTDPIAAKNTSFNHKEKDGTRIVRSRDDEKGVKKTLLVYLDEFDASSINILVYCFSKTVKWQDWLEVKQDVMFEMMDIMQKNNIEFAFPSLSLYHGLN